MHELDLGREQFIEPVAHDRVRLPAAVFHEYPRMRDPPRATTAGAATGSSSRHKDLSQGFLA